MERTYKTVILIPSSVAREHRFLHVGRHKIHIKEIVVGRSRLHAIELKEKAYNKHLGDIGAETLETLKAQAYEELDRLMGRSGANQPEIRRTYVNPSVVASMARQNPRIEFKNTRNRGRNFQPTR